MDGFIANVLITEVKFRLNELTSFVECLMDTDVVVNGFPLGEVSSISDYNSTRSVNPL